VAHHLIFDGWSLWVLLEDLRRLYTAALADRPAALPPLAAGYADFVRRQTDLLASPRGEELWDFWRRNWPREAPSLDLPFDRRLARPAVSGSALSFRLDEDLVGRLRELARQADTTLYTVLLAVFMVQLARYSGRPEVVVGSPVSGRTRADLRPAVGCFFNVLVLAAELSPRLSFRDLLGRLRRQVAAAVEHQDYPSHTLAERMESGWRAGARPLYTAQLIFQQLHPLAATVSLPAAGEGGLRLDLGSLVFEVVPVAPRAARSPLEMELIEAAGGVLGQLRYSADFLPETAARIAGHFETLLREVAADAADAAHAAHAADIDRPLADLELLPEAERELLLRTFSRADREYPATVPVHDLFHEQVVKTPHAVAAAHGGQALTFAELDGRADHLKTFLIGLDL
jgi:non-ribosomal peptide synthetase component F